jgi:hypothetical protein
MVAGAAPLLTMLYLDSRGTAGGDLDNDPVPVVSVLVLAAIAFLLSSGMVAGVLGRHQKGWSQLA